MSIVFALILSPGEPALSALQKTRIRKNVHRKKDTSEQPKVEASLDELRAAVRRDPASATAHNELGYALAHAGDPAQAIGEFEAAVKLNPKYADAYSNLGVAYSSYAPIRRPLSIEKYSPWRLSLIFCKGSVTVLRPVDDGRTCQLMPVNRRSPCFKSKAKSNL
jgi:tetratricopeptide (TPR) repeat protein